MAIFKRHNNKTTFFEPKIKYKFKTNTEYKPIEQKFNYPVEIINYNYPYIKTPLLTKNELYFYYHLTNIVANHNIVVLAKVRLADLIKVNRETTQYKDFYHYFRKIESKHIDFVLCNPIDLSVIALIELDDITHMTEKAIKNDEFKNEVLHNTGYKLIRCYSKTDIKQMLIDEQIIKPSL